MRSLLTSQIFEGIRRNDPQVLRYIYKSFFWKIQNFVFDYKGTEADAEDIFQEALVIIYQKIRDENVEISCSFKTFFFAVCRHLWFRQLVVRRQMEEVIQDSAQTEDVFRIMEDLFQSIDKTEARRMVQRHFSQLGETCQKILQLFNARVPLKEIAQIVGISEKFAKKKKFECKEKLLNQIKNDPLFKVYFDDERI